MSIPDEEPVPRPNRGEQRRCVRTFRLDANQGVIAVAASRIDFRNVSTFSAARWA